MINGNNKNMDFISKSNITNRIMVYNSIEPGLYVTIMANIYKYFGVAISTCSQHSKTFNNY